MFRKIVILCIVFCMGFVICSSTASALTKRTMWYSNSANFWYGSGSCSDITTYVEHWPGYNQTYNLENRTYFTVSVGNLGDGDPAYQVEFSRTYLAYKVPRRVSQSPPQEDIHEVLISSGSWWSIRTVILEVPNYSGPWSIIIPYDWKMAWSNRQYSWGHIYAGQRYNWALVGDYGWVGGSLILVPRIGFSRINLSS